METLILRVLLYLAGIILLIVFTVVGLKTIKIMDKTEKVIDEVDDKVRSLDGLFNVIDKVGYSMDHFANSVICKANNMLSKIFKPRKNKKKEDDDYE